MRQYSIIFLIVFLFSFLALKADDNLINGYIEVSDIDHVYLLTGDWKFYSGKIQMLINGNLMILNGNYFHYPQFGYIKMSQI